MCLIHTNGTEAFWSFLKLFEDFEGFWSLWALNQSFNSAFRSKAVSFNYEFLWIWNFPILNSHICTSDSIKRTRNKSPEIANFQFHLFLLQILLISIPWFSDLQNCKNVCVYFTVTIQPKLNIHCISWLVGLESVVL